MSNLSLTTEANLCPIAALLDAGFESPDVTGYSEYTAPTGWTYTNISDGFGWGEIGLNSGDEKTVGGPPGDWITTATDKQGIDPNYTNSGAYTNAGTIGTLLSDVPVKYRLKIRVAYDKANNTGKSNGVTTPGGNYDVKLVALPQGFTRAGNFNGTTSTKMQYAGYLLKRLNGVVANDDTIHEFVGTYTVDPVTDVSRNGYDLCVMIVGSTGGAIITHVTVEVVPGNREAKWTPKQITTAAWYDAADPTTVDDSTTPGRVEQFTDKSGNGHNVIQSTEADKPYTGTRTLNGLNVIESQVSEFLAKAGPVVTGNPDLLIAIVKMNDTNLSGNDMLVTFGTNTGGEFIGVSNGSSGRSFRYFNGYEAYGAVSLGAAQIQIGVRPSGGDYASAQMFINGTEDARTGGVNDGGVPNVLTDMNILGGVGGFTDGYVGEVIVTNDNSVATRQKIEGYLAHKWGLQANLPSTHPYRDNPPTRRWTPTEITTSAWYDAASPSTITHVAGAVSQWSDKSGNGKHATQANGALKPLTGSQSINGLNTIYFNFDWMDTNLTQLTTVSIYYLFHANIKSHPANNTPIHAINNGSGGIPSDGGCYVTLQNYGSPSTSNHSVFYTIPSAATRYLNGVLNAVDHGFNPGFASHQGTGLSTLGLTYKLGCVGIAGNSDANLDLGEVIICPSVHDVATRQRIEGYLAWKWGLVANLPVSHPYKTQPPYV